MQHTKNVSTEANNILVEYRTRSLPVLLVVRRIKHCLLSCIS